MSQKLKILVVDDDPGVLGLLLAVLERLDVDIETCSDPETALRLFEESAFDVVISDEPTAALDKHSGREVVDLLRRLAIEQGTTILLVTHDNRILDIADRILAMEDGRLIGVESPKFQRLAREEVINNVV